MTDFLPSLALFPPGALSSSVITTVWIGVVVVVFLHLRFGMTLSGLVVPGYLVPLLIVKPLAAVVTIAEGYATWGIAVLISSVLLRRAGAAEMFGRDRFFLLILVSVLVRVASDAWCLPLLGDALVANGIGWDPRGNLHSFGLVIISLIANQLWNAGFRRGTFQLAVFLGATWLIVRYVLMTTTNFSISSLGYMYEDLATSILASPKAYIILLTAALIASRMNLRYGWDFNGILIPSLLALQWYQPQKLVVTFAEALLILGIARLLLRVPLLANRNIEGAREMLLFFNIGFFYKLALGWLLVAFAPAVKATDWFAFGYLLSTLVALRMHQKDIAVRMTRTTLQTSLVAVAGASVIGFALTLLPLGPAAANTGAATASAPPVFASEFEPYVNNLRARLYAADAGRHVPGTEPALERFTAALETLAPAPADPMRQSRARALLEEIGMALTRTLDGQVVIHDVQAGPGRGIYVFAESPRTRLVLEVPAALDERGTADLATRLYRVEGARALAIAGTRRHEDPDGGSDALQYPRTFFQAFHATVATHNTLQVRAYTDETARLTDAVRADDEAAMAELEPRLWIRGALPEDLDVSALEKHVGAITASWAPPPWPNRQREHSRDGFAELMLAQSSLRSLAAGLGVAGASAGEKGPQRIDGYLQAWLLGTADAVAPRLSERYRVPELGELLFLDQEVVTPLLAVAAATREAGTEPDAREIDRIALLADVLGYRLVDCVHQRSGARYLVLMEKEGDASRHWGLLALRLGPAAPAIVELPRPLAEPGSLEFGVALFEQMSAAALLVSTAHPLANRDGSADVLSPRNTRTAFQAVHQAWLRESEGERLVVQVRGASTQTDAGTDARVALWEDNAARRHMPVTGLLTDALAASNIRFRYAGDGDNGGEHYALQGHYLDFAPGAEFATLWLSPALRAGYGAAVIGEDPGLPYVVSGIPSRVADIQAELRGAARAGGGVPPALRRALDRHLLTRDIVALSAARQLAAGYSLEHLIDADTRQPALVLRRGGAVVGALGLSRRETLPDIAWKRGDDDALRRFVDRRGGWLVVEGAP